MKKKKARVIIPSLFILLILLMGGTYAWLTQTVRGSKNNIIRAGSLMLTLEEGNGINLENAYPMTDAEGNRLEGYTFTLTNNANIANDYEIFLEDSPISNNTSSDDSTSEQSVQRIPDDKMNYSITKNGGIGKLGTLSQTKTSSGRLIDTGTIEAKRTNTYTLKLWINELAGNEIQGNIFSAKLRIEVSQATINENIEEAYVYQEDSGQYNYCITGEERTCTKTNCYEPKDPNSCDPGTVIKYRVNSENSKYFHVLHDDGKTMTVQDRDNTIENVTWSNINTSTGPQNVLQQIESVVNTWNNVNSNDYTLGEMNFIENSFTGCSSYNDCSINPYTLAVNASKSRIISVQEAINAGCSATTCPKWMYNYLTDCTSYGCPNPYGANIYGYWTLSANSINPTSSWTIANNGSLTPANIAESRGARAVVVINK